MRGERPRLVRREQPSWHHPERSEAESKGDADGKTEENEGFPRSSCPVEPGEVCFPPNEVEGPLNKGKYSIHAPLQVKRTHPMVGSNDWMKAIRMKSRPFIRTVQYPRHPFLMKEDIMNILRRLLADDDNRVLQLLHTYRYRFLFGVMGVGSILSPSLWAQQQSLDLLFTPQYVSSHKIYSVDVKSLNDSGRTLRTFTFNKNGRKLMIDERFDIDASMISYHYRDTLLLFTVFFSQRETPGETTWYNYDNGCLVSVESSILGRTKTFDCDERGRISSEKLVLQTGDTSRWVYTYGVHGEEVRREKFINSRLFKIESNQYGAPHQLIRKITTLIKHTGKEELQFIHLYDDEGHLMAEDKLPGSDWADFSWSIRISYNQSGLPFKQTFFWDAPFDRRLNFVSEYRYLYDQNNLLREETVLKNSFLDGESKFRYVYSYEFYE